jgi:hypothetical protein
MISAKLRWVSAEPTSTVPGMVQKKASGWRYSEQNTMVISPLTKNTQNRQEASWPASYASLTPPWMLTDRMCPPSGGPVSLVVAPVSRRSCGAALDPKQPAVQRKTGHSCGEERPERLQPPSDPGACALADVKPFGDSELRPLVGHARSGTDSARTGRPRQRRPMGAFAVLVLGRAAWSADRIGAVYDAGKWSAGAGLRPSSASASRGARGLPG